MKKVLFVGQAMPRVKRNPHDWPTLNVWLYSIGLTQNQIEENFLYSALVDYFPGSTKGGSHLVPTENEIKKERNRLAKTIKDFNPDIVVTIDKLSLSHCLNCEINLLNEFIGKTFEADPYGLFGKKVKIVPLAHPSGASTWKYKPENKKLLDQALGLLKENL